MGETKIEWADFTFNPWIGCTKVSPACDHCYAEGWAKRSGVVKWGAGEPRRRTTDANWAKPLAWDRAAARAGVRRRVFCASLADVFDSEVPNEWRDDLFHKLICRTPNLDWLLLTKRPQVARRYFEPYRVKGPPPNVWLGTTVEDQKMADLRIPILLSIPARVRFLSIEPMLGAVDITPWVGDVVGASTFTDRHGIRRCDITHAPMHGIDWVIAGGESGPHARPSHPDWFRSLRDQCQSAGVPFFFKQWGEWAPGECAPGPPTRTERTAEFFNGRWRIGALTPRQSEELHRDDGPDLYRVGKARAGALLDGREWREFPGSTTRRD